MVQLFKITQPRVKKAFPKGFGPRPRRAATRPAADPLTQLLTTYKSSLLTPVQQRRQAQQAVDAQIKMALAGARAATKSEQEMLRQQEDRARQFATAVGSLRSQDAAQIAAGYTQAAQQIQGLGTGLTGAVAQAQQAAANQAAAQVGQYTGGLGTAQGFDVPGLRNVAQFTGVTAPATDLFSEAQNQAAGARWRSEADVQRIANIADEYLTKREQAQRDLKNRRIELEAQRPGLYTEALERMASGNRQDMATLISALALQNTQSNTASQIADREVTQALDFYKTQNQALQDKLDTAIKTAKAEYKTPSGAPIPGTYTDKKGITREVPPDWIIDPKDPTRIIPDPSRKKAGQPSESSIQSNINRINKQIGDLVQGPPYAKNLVEGVLQSEFPPEWKPSMSYAQAKTRLLQKYPPSLRKNPQVLSAIDDALVRVGYRIGAPAKTTPRPPKTAGGVAGAVSKWAGGLG